VLAAVAMLVDVDGDRARNRAGSRSYNAILEEINVAQCSLNRDGAQTNAGAMVGEVTVLFWRRRWVPSASADNSEHRQRGRRSSGSWATTMRRRGQGEDRPRALFCVAGGAESTLASRPTVTALVVRGWPDDARTPPLAPSLGGVTAPPGRARRI
jgi:hypothetical protein